MTYANRCKLSIFDTCESEYKTVLSGIEMGGAVADFTDADGYSIITIAKNNVDENAIENIVNRFYDAYKDRIFSDEGESPAEKLVALCREKSVVAAAAESVTGGLIAARICGVDGASKIFFEGLVTYNSASKVKRLHVAASTIEEGVVSANTAREMAMGLFDSKSIDLAVAVTGCAGPRTDEYNTPVGKTFIAYGKKRDLKVKEATYYGSRNDIRDKIAANALFLLIKYVEKEF